MVWSSGHYPVLRSYLTVLENSMCLLLLLLLLLIIIIIIIIIIIKVFHISISWWSFTSKTPQVTRTLLSILAVLNNAVVRMISTHLLTSKSSSPFNNPLNTVPKAPITFGIIFTFMFHSFFQFFSKVEILILLFSFFQFYSVVHRDSKVNNFENCLFILIIIRCGLLAVLRSLSDNRSLKSPGLFSVF